ncbi:MAG: hypothetical protein KQH59_09225 [Desulfobulbaceae bacterium]|nr:hypothetical protein [Desulfobulbaceae bacterium]
MDRPPINRAEQPHPAAGLKLAQMIERGFLIRVPEKPAGGIYYTMELGGEKAYYRFSSGQDVDFTMKPICYRKYRRR